MNSFVLLPLIFLKFWYVDAPMGMVGYFSSLNNAFFELFSLPLFLRTFFKPLKNEYRQGLVGFSIAMGIVIKSFFIGVDLVFLFILLSFELSALAIFLLFPFLTILLLYV
ncbi:hypothetical protein HZA75_02525 [Candidatus Roizmanbacteria bacterium]|nr:hypothetical protein [Candidatus Roizmanbacteria bacterium]